MLVLIFALSPCFQPIPVNGIYEMAAKRIKQEGTYLHKKYVHMSTRINCSKPDIAAVMPTNHSPVHIYPLRLSIFEKQKLVTWHKIWYLIEG